MTVCFYKLSFIEFSTVQKILLILQEPHWNKVSSFKILFISLIKFKRKKKGKNSLKNLEKIFQGHDYETKHYQKAPLKLSSVQVFESSEFCPMFRIFLISPDEPENKIFEKF